MKKMKKERWRKRRKERQEEKDKDEEKEEKRKITGKEDRRRTQKKRRCTPEWGFCDGVLGILEANVCQVLRFEDQLVLYPRCSLLPRLPLLSLPCKNLGRPSSSSGGSVDGGGSGGGGDDGVLFHLSRSPLLLTGCNVMRILSAPQRSDWGSLSYRKVVTASIDSPFPLPSSKTHPLLLISWKVMLMF